jgi:hypothetical protein
LIAQRAFIAPKKSLKFKLDVVFIAEIAAITEFSKG